ncbi:transposase [Sphingobacterium sp. SYP-B4668]|uniref:transposase n=1 Tax=Sphingobacterium sp. SYP-B4668 TaxID=2996035 RepID=UPI003FA79F80
MYFFKVVNGPDFWSFIKSILAPCRTNLSTFFEYDEQVRKTIYTTNPIEGMHRQVRKITKTKGAFSSEQALMKLMFLIIKDISKKWTMPMHNWGLTISQLYIKFGDRLKLDRGF